MADKELSIGESLAAAFAESDGGGNEDNAGAENQEQAQDSSTEDKTQVQENNDKAASDEDQIKGDDGGTSATTLEPPQHWSEADKTAFKAATPEVQEWALRRDKEMTGDYTRKTQEIANFRKTWDPVNEMFASHIAQGMNPAAVIQRWAQVAQHLQQNPAQALQQLAQQYNINLSSLTQGQKPDNDDMFVDPRVNQLQQQLQQLQGHLQSRDQAELTARQRTYENEIQAFAEQKTETGDPAHPFFEEVMQDMMMLARSQRAAGYEPKLQDLYDNAVWSNPIVREKQLAAQQKAAAQKAEKEAIEKAKKAQKAAKSVGGAAPSEPAKDVSIRESLESLL